MASYWTQRGALWKPKWCLQCAWIENTGTIHFCRRRVLTAESSAEYNLFRRLSKAPPSARLYLSPSLCCTHTHTRLHITALLADIHSHITRQTHSPKPQDERVKRRRGSILTEERSCCKAAASVERDRERERVEMCPFFLYIYITDKYLTWSAGGYF